ncbi:phosphatase PAP2 family protein [Paracoccus sp. S3-43]|uniref:phosphatase PAP2 family protein n=1 Tax=Paracoccus sp. S3-43 TaxID=3030011 RepID=UPI0023AEF3D0|nr:phosphatase PAP2 family protein [Paracoccus sp. S3-43]WEF24477.1 phosphatase PAP2 family protein [Paracoccus sp. S3-43]
MSLQHGQHGQHGQAANAAGQTSDEALLAAALMRSRDAISGTEIVTPDPFQAGELDLAARLPRLAREYRNAVMISELLEDLVFVSEDDAPPGKTARAVALSRRKTGDPVDHVPLARIVRPGLADFSQAAPLVAAYAELRADRLTEILAQQRHLIPFLSSILPLDPVRNPALAEMLEVGLDLVTPVVMRVKLALGCPRPNQFSDRIQPLIPEPAHPTLPSGHATQIFTLATMLSLLADPDAQVKPDHQIYRLACRIAVNRTVAGVHFPADSASGAVLGIQLGRYVMARGLGGTVGSAEFDGGLFSNQAEPRDFHAEILDQMMNGDDPSTRFGDDRTAARAAPLWRALCQRARQEWQNRWS